MSATAREDSPARRVSVLGAFLLRGLLLVLGLAGVCLLLAAVLGGSSQPQVASGLLTLVLMLTAGLYAARRRSMRLSLLILRPFWKIDFLRPYRSLAVRLDRTQSWRTAHLIVGVLWALALWWHVDASRGTWLETSLLAGCILVLASGVFGGFLQFWLPRSMLQIIEREVREEDVIARQNTIFVAAEEKILGGSERLVDAYLSEIRPRLVDSPRQIGLFEDTLRRRDPGAHLRGRLWRLPEGMDDSDAEKVRELVDLAEHKGRLDLNLYHLRLSVGWLKFHDALVLGTVALLVPHLLSVVYF